VALDAAEELDASVVNMRFVKPLDDEMVSAMARKHDLLVTLEDNVIEGGAGSAVAESLAAQGIAAHMLHLGLPDRFIDHGDQWQLLALAGLDRTGVLASVCERLAGMPQAASMRVA